jgi:UDP-GlcNAc:undecaprenyl-phosphate GlcNAc-1-phosphate transferase
MGTLPFAFATATALVLSMVIIPLVIRWAPVLGMVDKPDRRKVHTVPVARVGGFGIVIGTLVAVILWVPLDRLLTAYVLGALVLFVFGTADDRREMGHYVKFVGQFIAVGLVVFYGDLVVWRVPFLYPDTLAPALGIPLTLFAMVGVINAINHSDGLDGLAGGEVMLSLLALGLLGRSDDSPLVTAVAAATIGGLFGFLRYNTHPARVFMGDSGSQFLGFTVGFLAVLLTQRVNTAISPATALLALGLPVIDIIVVLFLRIKEGRNWFRATRNHVHHRLLDIGLTHQASVVVIYSVQATFVLLALLLMYSRDSLIVATYFSLIVALFAALITAERQHRSIGHARLAHVVTQVVEELRWPNWARTGAKRGLEWILPAYLVMSALGVQQVPRDFAVVSLVLSVVLVLTGLRRQSTPYGVVHLSVYVAMAFATFLSTFYPPGLIEAVPYSRYVIFGTIAALVGVSLKTRAAEQFRTTPMDYLAILLVVGVSVLQFQGVFQSTLWPVVVKAIILFYAAEVVISEDRYDWRPLRWGTVAAFMIFAVRGLVFDSWT